MHADLKRFTENLLDVWSCSRSLCLNTERFDLSEIVMEILHDFRNGLGNDTKIQINYSRLSRLT